MNQDLINETFSEDKTEEELLDINIKFNLGKLIISPLSGSKLFQLDATYPNENYTPIIKYTKSKKGNLWLESQRVTQSIPTTFSIDKIFDLFSREKRDDTIKSSSNVWDLKLAKDIPIELDIRGGATDQNIELGGLKLTFFKLTTGASLTKIRFTEKNEERLVMKIEAGASSFEAYGLGRANIEEMKFTGGVGKSTLNLEGELTKTSSIEIVGGLGFIDIEIPKSTGTIVGAKSSNFLSINNIPKSYSQKGDVYVNEAYQEDKPHLNISLDLTMGSLKIIEI